MNNSNTGGYLRWALGDQYRIFTDLENTIPFRDEDFYLATHAFSNKLILTKLLMAYQPSFISVPLTSVGFADLIKDFPDYALVFFDDVEALYVNRRRYPGIVKDYELKGVDIFKVLSQSVDEMSGRFDREPLMLHLSRLLSIDPSGMVTNYMAALLFKNQGRYDQMLPHAFAIIQNFPEMSLGYQLQGDAFKGLRAFDQAVVAYGKALERAVGTERVEIRKRMGLSYAAMGNDRQAYRAFKQSIQIFSDETPHEDLYQYAVAARRSGHLREARLLLQFILEQRIAPQDAAWREKVTQELGKVISAP